MCFLHWKSSILGGDHKFRPVFLHLKCHPCAIHSQILFDKCSHFFINMCFFESDVIILGVSERVGIVCKCHPCAIDRHFVSNFQNKYIVALNPKVSWNLRTKLTYTSKRHVEISDHWMTLFWLNYWMLGYRIVCKFLLKTVDFSKRTTAKVLILDDSSPFLPVNFH